MNAPLAKFIDWHALQVAAMLPSIRKCARGDSKLTEAIEFVNGPNFVPAESKPAELGFKSEIHFTFPSPRPCENILLIQGHYDLVVEAEQTEELWQTWKQPEIWRLPHGHISWMGVPGLTGRVLRWLSPRLNAPGVQARPQTTRPDNAELQEGIKGDSFGFRGNRPNNSA